MWQEYKSLNLVNLHETVRILGHYFLLVCERLSLPLDNWYGREGARANAKGFKYVTGICEFVTTFETESDLQAIEQLLKSLPIVQDAYKSGLVSCRNSQFRIS